ncbi:hypothetical protein JJB07_11475 [Tumebacillus sp. ITR2]|uniref:PD-(D/E)XK endonuclease-like domain-containing protein n=1 Tax=Tumebacillus amylolyticus TaxID=2801339 RepID=A0ABS1JAH1_9BACL|nr:hypothetical protein [Tumebacillus amylolyticus]MBL0387271.1 hypothetical protein [Tumebacillus amylolyticus]
MATKMIAYANPFELESDMLDPYRDVVHICATNSLRKGVHSFYQCERRYFTGVMVGTGMFLRQFLGDWSKPRTKLLQFAQLSERLLELEEGVRDPKVQMRFRAFRRNQLQVLETMRVLTEIGIDVNRIEVTVQTEDERFFVELWKWMDQNGYWFRRIRHDLGTRLHNPEILQTTLKEALCKCDDLSQHQKDQLPDRIDQIILHGFYFITPLQHRIFKLFENAGIELVFLNLYDERYKKTFAPVRTFIEAWVPYEDWSHLPIFDGPEISMGEMFANLYESDRLQDTSHSGYEVTLKPHANFHSLLDEYTEYPNGRDGSVEYYSPEHEPLNDRIMEYYPEYFKERHFLAYPIGQYLLHLHRMWNEIRQELILDEQSLFECFASGWLREGDHNGRQYLTDLRDLLPYFQGCRTYCEWAELLEELIDMKKNLSMVWQPVPSSETSSQRFHEMMGDPLLRFSFMKVQEDNLKVVILLVRKLWEQALELFGQKNARTSLSEHFVKLERLLQSGLSDEALLESERAALERLREELASPRDEKEKYRVQDLAVAISLYLSNVFSDEGERDRMIRSFDDLDGVSFLQNKRIHVCGLSEEALPKNQFVLPWPLTRPLLEKLTEIPEIRMMLYRDKYSSEFARYLFYHVLAFSQEPVSLSWMRDWGGKDLEESVYVKVLGLPVSEEARSIESTQSKIEMPLQEEFEIAYNYMEGYPIDAVAEHELCPRRFFYSYLAKPFPTYQSEFHHQFLMAAMFMLYHELTDRDDDEAFDQIHKLFPLWTDIKLRDIQTYADKIRDGVVESGSDRFEDREYSRIRKQFHFLKPMRQLNAYKQGGYELRIGLEGDRHLILSAKPSSECKYCPHLSVCTNGLHPIDES